MVSEKVSGSYKLPIPIEIDNVFTKEQVSIHCTTHALKAFKLMLLCGSQL